MHGIIDYPYAQVWDPRTKLLVNVSDAAPGMYERVSRVDFDKVSVDNVIADILEQQHVPATQVYSIPNTERFSVHLVLQRALAHVRSYVTTGVPIEITNRSALPVVSVDFDGVVHSDTQPWVRADVVQGAPVPGALSWIQSALDCFNVAIFSVRNSHKGGSDAIRAWLVQNGVPAGAVELLSFPIEKPKAIMYLDDRGFRFTGTWPTLQEIRDFKPWNK